MIGEIRGGFSLLHTILVILGPAVALGSHK